jgi:hypothetical protein
MRILLSGSEEKYADLRDLYNRAFKEAKELYIASAYLTDWDPAWKIGSACEKMVFVVGRDFGLTRKSAMLAVLKLIPKGESSFFAADTEDGFHPKIVAWKSGSGRNYCIVGSSNLSRAGLSTNYEANVFSLISAPEFDRIRVWIDSIAMIPITEEWITGHYNEAPRLGGRKAADAPVHLKLLPTGSSCAQSVRDRRRHQENFAGVADKVRGLLIRCAGGPERKNAFWKKFWSLYRADPSWRLQGRGWWIRGKGARWSQACGALVHILEAGKTLPENQLDGVVAGEIDRLAKAGNSVRGAWLSEMLCHYLPKLYPVDNGPVQKWWSYNKLPHRRGATEGQKYAELAKKLRWVLRKFHPSGARNLAELDAAIHCCLYEKGLLNRRST